MGLGQFCLIPSFMMNGFNENLRQGLMAESLIAKWLVGRGWTILPAYEKEPGEFKGPRIYSAVGQLISPDMLAFRYGPDRGEIRWIEAKNKSAFAWYRKHQRWVDGIDKRCWLDYLELQKLAPWDIWLLFLHAPGHLAKDTPPGKIPPTGMFGETIKKLANHIDHESERWGSGGMVYWQVDDLRLLSSWNDFQNTLDSTLAAG